MNDRKDVLCGAKRLPLPAGTASGYLSARSSTLSLAVEAANRSERARFCHVSLPVFTRALASAEQGKKKGKSKSKGDKKKGARSQAKPAEAVAPDLGLAGLLGDDDEVFQINIG